ncbi:hypothetical protein [Streptomyces aureus]|uniref:hypothetical protein n=1 Tax=Streptomyces aureus TaxID=193461 RepID=UPI00363C73FA
MGHAAFPARPSPSPDAAAAHGGGSPTLGQAVGVVGPDVLEVLRAPCGTDVPVSGAGVFDEGETLQARGRILIAPGVDTSAPGAAGVLRAADRAGAAAVVLRRGAQGIAPSLAEAADEVSTALLARAPWIEWGELIGLLRAAIARTGTAPAEASADVALGDLPGLALALAALVGGAITVEDPESNVLAYSPTADTADPLRRLTILGRRVPSWRVTELAESGFLTTLWASGDVVHRPADARFPERLAVAVRAGDEILGSLWAAADGEPLPSGARDALRQAAVIAVPHLLHHRLRSRSAASRRRYAVRALFEERPPDVATAAAVLGVEAGQACTVLTATAAAAIAPDVLDRAFHLASSASPRITPRPSRTATATGSTSWWPGPGRGTAWTGWHATWPPYCAAPGCGRWSRWDPPSEGSATPPPPVRGPPRSCGCCASAAVPRRPAPRTSGSPWTRSG